MTTAMVNDAPLNTKKKLPEAIPVSRISRLSIPRSIKVLSAPTSANFAAWYKILNRLLRSQTINSPSSDKIGKTTANKMAVVNEESVSARPEGKGSSGAFTFAKINKSQATASPIINAPIISHLLEASAVYFTIVNNDTIIRIITFFSGANMLKNFSLSITARFAILLLGAMAAFMFAQAARQNTTVDENPHIAAGYSYLVERDYRLNPEHPPLIKGLAAIPLVIGDFNFPTDSSAWTDDVNGQWTLGTQFLYESGNNPDTMAFLARVFPILITLAFGTLLFIWARELFGSIAALFALTMFVFSPNFLAHGALVTTDVGAAFAFFFATYFLFRYLKRQTNINLLIAGLAFGLAQLIKFSLILLIPYFVGLIVLWVLFKDRPLQLISFQTVKKLNIYVLKLIFIGLIGLAVVYPAYQYTIADYPAERQARDTAALLENHPNPMLAKAVIWMSDKPVLRAYGQFFLGHLMVFQRVSGGNTTYFLGDVSSTAWKHYFPVVFALKTPFALLVMMGLAGAITAKAGWRETRIIQRSRGRWRNKLKRIGNKGYELGDKYFYFIAFALFIVFYWMISILGNLNIGFRHILPTMPFIYLIIIGVLHYWMHEKITVRSFNPIHIFFNILRAMRRRWTRITVVFVLVIWYTASSLSVYPHFISFFTEAIGGAQNGYKFVVDSNLDWGQDLRGLAKWVDERDIEKIKVDYFGGGSPSYYLGEKYEPFNPSDVSQRHGWIAISATLLQSGRGEPTKGYDKSTAHYMWLNDYEPVITIGHSIFIYNIK